MQMLFSLNHRTAAGAALTFFLATTTAFAAAQKLQNVLTPDERAKVNKLLQEYRTAGNDLEKKQGICQKALEIGPGAAPLVVAAVERDLQPQLRRYCAKFQAQAATAAKQKIGRVDFNKVVQLRRAVLDLQKLGDDFTHQLIVEKIDPAVAKLRAVFTLDRSEVLDKWPDLQADRKKLEGLGRLWETCRIQLPSPEHADKEKSAPVTFDDYLQGEEELAASMAIPQDPRTRAVLAMNARLADKIDPEEARAILELNLVRNLLGLPVLAIDLKLCAAARDHSTDMEKLKFFSHESPVSGKKSFTDRAKNFGTTAGGENIFAGSSSGKGAHEAWFHSPGHHRNQMGNSLRVGVGRCGTHFTQMFGG